MTDLTFNKEEKSKLINKIKELIEKLLSSVEGMKFSGKFIYIQNDKIEHEEFISQEELVKHPFIESFKEDSNFRNSLMISPSTGILTEHISEINEVYKIIIKEENTNEINIILEAEKI